jgi:hypothetical protein
MLTVAALATAAAAALSTGGGGTAAALRLAGRLNGGGQGGLEFCTYTISKRLERIDLRHLSTILLEQAVVSSANKFFKQGKHAFKAQIERSLGV